MPTVSFSAFRAIVDPDDPTVPELDRLVAQYVDAVNTTGLGSPAASAVRARGAADHEFLQFADSFDRLKQCLTVRGTVGNGEGI